MGYVDVMGTNHDMYFDTHLMSLPVAWVVCTCHRGFTSLGNCVEFAEFRVTQSDEHEKAIQLASL